MREPGIDGLVRQILGGCFSDAHNSVAQHFGDRAVFSETHQLVTRAQLLEEFFHVPEEEIAVRCDDDVGDIARLPVRLQEQLVPEFQRLRGEG